MTTLRVNVEDTIYIGERTTVKLTQPLLPSFYMVSVSMPAVWAPSLARAPASIYQRSFNPAAL